MTEKARHLARRYGIVLTVVTATAASDLWTKRWAERNLATPDHLIPVRATGIARGTTVGEVVRSRWSDLDDATLNGNLFRVEMGMTFSPEQPVYRVEANGPPIFGFFVFDEGDLDSFARRVDRPDPAGLERRLAQENPGLSPEEVRARVRDLVDQTTLDAFLAEALPHLSEKERQRTIAHGLFPARGRRDLVAPNAPAEEGALYLVGHREVVLIPEHLDFSYAENPAGAWGLLADVDDDVRRTVFFVLSLVAIAVVVGLLVRPPSEHPASLVSLGGILGGAIGNVVDRLSTHYVVDFIHMYWGDYHWPRYNIADIGITVGVIVLLLSPGKPKRQTKTPSQTPVPDARRRTGNKA